MTNISSPPADRWSGTRCEPNSFAEPNSGVGDPFGTGTRNPNQPPHRSPLSRFLAAEAGSNWSTNRSPRRSYRRSATRPRKDVPAGILNEWNRPSNDWACSPLSDPEDDLASEIRPHSMTTSPDPFYCPAGDPVAASELRCCGWHSRSCDHIEHSDLGGRRLAPRWSATQNGHRCCRHCDCSTKGNGLFAHVELQAHCESIVSP